MTTPADTPSPDDSDNDSPGADSAQSGDAPGAELGQSDGPGGTFEPEEDVEPDG
jgi:hypothetical protein